MDNMGSLRRLYYIDAADYISRVKGQDDLYTITLKNGAVITEIEFIQGTGKISESEEAADNGSIYNFEASCRIAKCQASNLSPLGDLAQKKLLILGEDNNDNFWLAGTPGSYFNINMSSTTGETPQDMNGRQLKISAPLMSGSIFVVSPL